MNMFYLNADDNLINKLLINKDIQDMEFNNNSFNEFCLKNSFLEFCESIEDDEFFLKVCEKYDKEYPGGIKELNDNPTLERINNFKICVQSIALEESSKFLNYYDRASTSNF